jgi:hypothetical protein
MTPDFLVFIFLSSSLQIDESAELEAARMNMLAAE